MLVCFSCGPVALGLRPAVRTPRNAPTCNTGVERISLRLTHMATGLPKSRPYDSDCHALRLLDHASAGSSDLKTDSRNINIPGTWNNAHFQMPVSPSCETWLPKIGVPFKQILASAPLPLFRCRKRRWCTSRSSANSNSKATRQEKVLLETYPGFYLAGNLYRPLGKKGPFPGSSTAATRLTDASRTLTGSPCRLVASPWRAWDL